MIAGIVAAIAMACAAAVQVSVPTVGNLEAVPDGDGGTLALVARVTVGGFIVGFALSCEGGGPLATVYLGPFPARLQALQLATRTAGGAVTRFGPAFRADAARGFHSLARGGRPRRVPAGGARARNPRLERLQLVSGSVDAGRTDAADDVPGGLRTMTGPGKRLTFVTVSCVLIGLAAVVAAWADGAGVCLRTT
ncbi:MAG: hypothetical protein OXI15_02070 [Chromatiales bacterium]|nr:hypothetical protein [Chromatiales bacterium]